MLIACCNSMFGHVAFMLYFPPPFLLSTTAHLEVFVLESELDSEEIHFERDRWG